MKNRKQIIWLVVAILVGIGAYFVMQILDDRYVDVGDQYFDEPKSVRDMDIVKIRSAEDCPPLNSQQARMSEGKPLPGKYQFVSDFTQDVMRCEDGWLDGGWGPSCRGEIENVTITRWKTGDVIYSCRALWDSGDGPDDGWGIGIMEGSHTRVPLRYVEKVSDTTPITE
jgi:hypothetical protein